MQKNLDETTKYLLKIVKNCNNLRKYRLRLCRFEAWGRTKLIALKQINKNTEELEN